ncbi:MAG TPA: DUF4199 domain-containing protein, partial [Flavitalea sp.]|nr:DUF4199 domain-containing protein [Flavitalea sp.]
FLSYAWFNYIILIFIAVMAGLAKKKANDGYLPFPEALKTVFGTMILAMFIQMIFNYVLFNFIDVPFSEAIKQASIDKGEQMLKRFNAPQDDIDKYLDKMAKDNPNSIGNLVMGFAIFAIVAFLISLIISAIIKRNKPEFENTFKDLQ